MQPSPAPADGLTVIPSGSVTTAFFSAEVASPSGFSLVWCTPSSTSSPVGADALVVVGAAVNVEGIARRSQPPNGPRGVCASIGFGFRFFVGAHRECRLQRFAGTRRRAAQIRHQRVGRGHAERDC